MNTSTLIQAEMFPEYKGLTPPRPTYDTIDKKQLFTKLAEEMQNIFPNHDFEECFEALSELFDSAADIYDDGYEMGKRFEDYGFEVDAQVVLELDFFARYFYDGVEKALTEWVDKYEIETPFKVGDKVKSIRSTKDEPVGTVKNVYANKAQVIVNYPRIDKDSGYIIDVENCELVETVE